MKEIPLINGGVALVDDEDYPRLMQWEWKQTSDGYAGRVGRNQTAERGLYHLMQHLLMGGPAQDGFCLDHENTNQLDNQRRNLRVVTRSVNAKNRAPGKQAGPRFSACETCGRKGILHPVGSEAPVPCKYCDPTRINPWQSGLAGKRKQSRAKVLETLILHADAQEQATDVQTRLTELRDGFAALQATVETLAQEVAALKEQLNA